MIAISGQYKMTSVWGHHYHSRVERIRAHKFIWHFCTPKCASTFLMLHMQRATANNPSVVQAACIPMPKNRPQVVCAYTISNAMDTKPGAGLVLGRRTHATATEDLIDMISDKHVVVIQTRSIFDTVTSLFDHLNKQPRSPYWANNQVFWADLTDEQKYDHIINIYVPWHIQFIQGWESAAAKLNVVWLNYDEVVKDPDAAAGKVFAFHSVAHEKAVVTTAENGQFNVGKSGRGREKLSDRHQAKITDMVSSYTAIWEKHRCSPFANLNL